MIDPSGFFRKHKMANTIVEYHEIRFDVRNPELTHMYVFIKALNDSPIGVEGWHHKVFPASMSILDIMQSWNDGNEEPLIWSLEAPAN